MENNKNKSVYESEEFVEWGGFLNEFLWICAGVNRRILRQCPTDYAKYAGSGGTILFTALMAILSGGYAMYFVFDSTWIAVAFGIFWGLLIFNLDRYIVNTMYSDGLPTISWGEVRSGLPRIIMAIFLGMVISTPLEMKIFSDRIDSQLIKDNIERTNASRNAVVEGNKPLTDRRNQLEKERAEIAKRLSIAQQELTDEGVGNHGKFGRGPKYQEYSEKKDAIQHELSEWDAAHTKELEELRLQIQTNTDRAGKDIQEGNHENGFCVRYEAFSHVKEGNLSLQIVSIVIMMLFIIIETAPTFFKMMISSGPYDDLLRADMQRVRALSDQEIKEIEDKVSTELAISTEKNKKRLEAEIKANDAVLKKLADAQAELIEEAIKQWKEKELANVKEDPNKYINSSQQSL